MRKVEELFKKPLISEFLRFISVGVLNTAINYLVYLFFLKILSLNYLFSGVVGFLSGAVTGFYLNRNWTFKSSVNIMSGSLKYLLIQIVNLGAHSLAQYISHTQLGVSEEISQFAGIIVTTFLNFILIRYFVFRK